MTLKEFIKKHPEYQFGNYSELAKKFDVSYETVRHIARNLRKEQKFDTSYNKKRQEFSEKGSIDNKSRALSTSEFAEFKAWKSRVGAGVKKYDRKRTALPRPYLHGNPDNVLVIPDTHLPFELDGALEFVREQQEKWDCGTVVHIGDFLDNHATAFFDADPDGLSAGDEFEASLEKAKDWYEVFPTIKIAIGNHDNRVFRQAFKAGLPKHWLKSYKEMLQTPDGWDWDFSHEVNGVIYTHGSGLSGDLASLTAARENRQSTVIGHLHSLSNIRYLANNKDTIFGMTVGCLIKNDEYSFAYGKDMPRKPVLNCGIVLNGEIPILIPYNK